MKDQFLIIPPPNLVQKWWDNAAGTFTDLDEETYLAIQAATWGANQELEACVDIVCDTVGNPFAQCLRAKRRPKLPTLKEQAMKQLIAMEQHGALDCNVDAIRRALEALPNDN